MFSVVIPIFNESENIKSLFEEIKESLKKYKDFELIYVNDCSTDDSDVPLTKIKNNNINIQVLFNKKNQGQSYSINKGIQSAIYNTILTELYGRRSVLKNLLISAVARRQSTLQNRISDITEVYEAEYQANRVVIGGSEINTIYDEVTINY